MSENGGESASPPAGHEDIMDATHRALVEHGFAALTMQDIADEAEKSKGLLHYHYDTKQDLLVAFFDHLIEQWREPPEEHEGKPPAEHLRDFVRGGLVDNGEEEWGFVTAVVELRAQAPHDDTYREQLVRNEEVIREYLADIIREGVEDGSFREVDPESTARLVLAAMDGARTQKVVLDDNSPAVVCEALLEQVVDPLLADGTETGAGRSEDGPDSDDTSNDDDRAGDATSNDDDQAGDATSNDDEGADE